MPENGDIFPPVRWWPQPVHAGFPSPGDDWKEPPLNLHDLVVPHPLSSYFIRVSGDSMRGACIRAGDIVVVDRALTAAHRKIVVARVGEHLLLKRVQVQQRKVFLHADPPELPAIELDQQADMEIWGVVTYCVHRVR
jgi:DNA polymerase V